MTIRRCLLVLSLPLFCACGKGRKALDTGQAPPPTRAARYRLEAGPATALEFAQYPESLYAVSIRGAKASVRIPGVFIAHASELAPRADSMAFADLFDSTGRRIGILRFRHDSPRLDTLRFPPGYSVNLSSIAFSLGGLYMAYVDADSGPLLYGVVRRVADQSLVRRTPSVLGPDGTDAQIGYAYWADSTAFVIGIVPGSTADWSVRFRGRIGVDALIQDTVDNDEHPIHVRPPPEATAPAPPSINFEVQH